MSVLYSASGKSKGVSIKGKLCLCTGTLRDPNSAPATKLGDSHLYSDAKAPTVTATCLQPELARMLPIKSSMTPSTARNAGVGAPTLHAVENLQVTYSQLALYLQILHIHGLN